jgi:hypothetical protein
MIENIAFDEAGNTGDDLLNKGQKVFTLASNNFKDFELASLFSSFDNNSEAHFVKLKNSKLGRKQLLDFINSDLITEKNIQLSACDKEFAVVSQLVDQIYEPHFNSKGIDIYKNIIQLTLANMIYYFGKNSWDRGKYERFLSAFVSFIRSKEKESFLSFGAAIDELRQVMSKEEIEVLIFPLLQPKTYLDEVRSAPNKYSLDFTLSLFLIHCDKWYKSTGNKLSVQFDNSKQIEYHKKHIEWVKSFNCPTTDVGYGEKTMTFPSQIESLDLVNSENYLSVQCSDILASTIAFYYNNTNKKREIFRKQIRESKLFKLKNYYNIWPSVECLSVSNKASNGLNIIDFIMKFEGSFPTK